MSNQSSSELMSKAVDFELVNILDAEVAVNLVLVQTTFENVVYCKYTLRSRAQSSVVMCSGEVRGILVSNCTSLPL